MCKNIHPKTIVLGKSCESWSLGQLLPLQCSTTSKGIPSDWGKFSSTKR
jgi:hypothetical protein